jgi:hypothetical protein
MAHRIFWEYLGLKKENFATFRDESRSDAVFTAPFPHSYNR